VGSPGPWRGVGKTALGMAVVRARESGREDRLFDDPYAQAFVDAAPGAFPGASQAAGPGDGDGRGALRAVGAAFSAHAVIRTRFYDEWLTAAVGDGCGQVVLLAAGLDTRALRLGWPAGTRVFEMDLAAALAFKEAVLARCGAVPRCERVTVPADLRGDWAAELVAAGFDRAQPAAWLAEGLIIYLTAGEAGRLLGAVGGLSVPGGQLAFEHNPAGTDTVTARARQLPAMRPYVSLWKGGLSDAPGWLTGHGWRPRFHELAMLGRSYRRPVPRPGPQRVSHRRAGERAGRVRALPPPRGSRRRAPVPGPGVRGSVPRPRIRRRGRGRSRAGQAGSAPPPAGTATSPPAPSLRSCRRRG
jgi:methyltransferase (TIGR00027 family)